MPVALEVESLDGLDDSLKGAYVEKDGKFTLDVDKYAEVKASGLKTKNQEILRKLNEAKVGLKKYEKLAELEDDDIEELLTLRANKGKEGDGNGKDAEAAKAAQQKLLDKAAAKHAAEKAAIEGKLTDAEKRLKHFQLTVPLKDIALKAGVFPEDLDLVMLDTQKRFTLSDDGKIVVLDEDGDPATDVTPQKFFESLYKELRPKFYKASGAGGSGAQNGTDGKGAGKKVMKRSEWEKLSPTESSAFFKDGGTLID